MLRILALAAAFIAAAGAQTPSPITVQFGGLYCAAIRRPPVQVQTYCYLYPASPSGWVLVANAINTVTPGSILVSTGQCSASSPNSDPTKLPTCTGGDAIAWQFWLMPNGTIQYNYAAGAAATLVSGTLP
jgi:hypothetical protein